MSEIICLLCNRPCDVHESKMPIEFTPGVPSEGVYLHQSASACCWVGYRIETVAERIQREALAATTDQHAI